MTIRLIESGRRFSDEDVDELKRFLSQLPPSHLYSLDHIERVHYTQGLANSSPFGGGEEIRLPSTFYHLDKEEREFVFLHEMGHNYFDFRDYTEGDISMLKYGKCRKQDVSHLLRVQWMELGWELNPENWERVKAICPENEANRDKYTYMVMYKNPNHELVEWTCLPEARIPKNSVQYAFRYDKPFYSPKEEMADAYALFVLNRNHFLKASKTSDLIKAKYDFMSKCFPSEPKQPVIIKRD
jgi:hypothetical protein